MRVQFPTGLVCVGVLLSLMCWTNTADAQRRRSARDWRVGVGGVFNVGGEVEVGPIDADLRATIGLRGHLDKGVFARDVGEVIIGISVGGQLALAWWAADDDDYPSLSDRNFLFDVVARVHLTIDWNELRVYLGPNPGMTVSVLNNDAPFDSTAGFVFRFVALGIEYFFKSNIAVFGELGFVGHYTEHDLNGAPGDENFEIRQTILDGGILFSF